MVGIRSFPFGWFGLFSGALPLVFGSVVRYSFWTLKLRLSTHRGTELMQGQVINRLAGEASPPKNRRKRIFQILQLLKRGPDSPQSFCLNVFAGGFSSFKVHVLSFNGTFTCFFSGNVRILSKMPGKHRNSYHDFRQLDCWFYGFQVDGLINSNYQQFSRCSNSNKSRWWFQIFFIFIPTWGNNPIWLIFFRWVETTN